MTVIPSVFIASKDVSALTLVRYAQLIRYDENAFFGINAPNNRERACRKIWTKLERDMMVRYLGEAQAMIERVLMYPIGQKWYVDEMHHNTPRFFTKWARLQSLGTFAQTNIALNIALNHTTDPATIAATATTVIDQNEIHFYQTGTDVEVYPDTMTLSGGFVTATFPRARLVTPAFQDNPEIGLSYTDTTALSGIYAQAVDIKRVYTDNTDVGEFVFPLGKECEPECDEDVLAACGYIRSNESGVVTLLPASDGSCIWHGASEVRINYCAGTPLDNVSEDAILHLAHALMPIEPCSGCDPLLMLWKNDREIPSVITADRANCMFGVNNGAWRAWNFAHTNKHLRMSFI